MTTQSDPVRIVQIAPGIGLLIVGPLPAGNNNIGDVDIASLPAGVIAGMASLPIGVNNIGDVDVASIAAGETHIGEMGGNTTMAVLEFTRAAVATTYHAGDVVGGLLIGVPTVIWEIPTFARIVGASGYITGIRICYNTKSVTPRFRVHLYNALGATVSADDALWKDMYADQSKRIANYDMPALVTPALVASSDMCMAEDFSMRIPFKCAAATRSIFFGIETLDGFVSVSGDKITVKIYGELN